MKQPSAGTDTTAYVKKAISEMEMHIPEIWNKFYEMCRLNIIVSDDEQEEIYGDVWRFVNRNELNKEVDIFYFMAAMISYIKSS